MAISVKPLADAVEKISAKTPVGSTLRSAEWAEVPLAIRERAQFSAGVTSARVLQTIQDRMQGALKLEREKLANGKSARFDRSSFIDALRQVGREEGLDAALDPKDRGTIKDITSVPRLGLIFDMQQAQAQEFARWKADQDEGALLVFPAYEFKRIENRREKRANWPDRWAKAARETGDAEALQVLRATGRMIALKTSGIWSKLSIFGTPWPPFDWGSGMGLEDVSRDEAVSMGLLKADTRPQPVVKHFNDDLQASVRNIQPGLMERLQSFLTASEAGSRMVKALFQS